jgi:hypothetical protein
LLAKDWSQVVRNLIFSKYKNRIDTQAEIISETWDYWLKKFSTHAVRGNILDYDQYHTLNVNKDGPAVILGQVNGTRCKKNVVKIDAQALDLDNVPTEKILHIFKKMSHLEWVAYTTHKHGSKFANGLPRIRIILPLKKSISPAEHDRLWLQLNDYIGGHNDPSTKDASRLHYLPSTFDPSLSDAQHNRGDWLDLDTLPAIRSATDSNTSQFEASEQLAKIRKLFNTLSKGHVLKDAAKKLLNGESIALEGARHNTLLDLTMWLAKRRPDLTQKTIELLFERSVKAMPGISLHEVWTAYEGAIVKIQERAQEAQLSGQDPYTEAELAQIAEAQGWAPADLTHRWIVQIDGGGWVLDQTGHYQGLFSRLDLPQAIWSILAPAPVQLLDITPTGYKHRGPIELVRDYGTLAQKVLSDLAAKTSKFDPDSHTMREAVCPIRSDLAPKFDPQFDTWLKIFGGDYYTKLVDWLSVVPQLDRLLCALYINGEKGIGKTMLAHGLARIWTEGSPTKLSQVLGDFNEALVDCPLILADEKLPKKSKWDSITEDLREMVSTTSRELTRKYKAPSKLLGAIRLILCANNEFLLESAQTYSRADQEAIAQRFLYLKIGASPAEYLGTIPRDVRRHWWDRGIAEHALYLHQNHTVQNPGVRFEVEGDESVMHRLLMTGSYWNSLVCEWLVRYLNHPKPMDVKQTGLVRCIEGDLLVNEQALIDGWEIYLGQTRSIPETAKIGAALRALAKGPERKQLRFNGSRIRYRYIDVNHLVDWSERFNIGDSKRMISNLKHDDADFADFKGGVVNEYIQ